MTIVPGALPYRLFDTHVIRTRRLTPTFVRVTLGAPSLRLRTKELLQQKSEEYEEQARA